MTSQEALAAALVKSDLMRRYMDYAHDAHPLIGRETVEEIAANWAPLVLAALDGWTLVPANAVPDAERLDWLARSTDYEVAAEIARLRTALEHIVALPAGHYRRNGFSSPDPWVRQRDVNRIARAALAESPR
jgi:hypothetical protein